MRAKFINEKISDDPVSRLKSDDVVYMELKNSKFRCGECISFTKGSFCQNKKVLSVVNKDGCCNLYFPAKKDDVDPKDWKVNTNESLNEKKNSKKRKSKNSIQPNFNKTDYQNIHYEKDSKPIDGLKFGGHGKMLKPNFKHL